MSDIESVSSNLSYIISTPPSKYEDDYDEESDFYDEEWDNTNQASEVVYENNPLPQSGITNLSIGSALDFKNNIKSTIRTKTLYKIKHTKISSPKNLSIVKEPV